MRHIKILLSAAIIPYLAIYLIVGPQEVPDYSPAQWWPTAQKVLFVLGVLILMWFTVGERFVREIRLFQGSITETEERKK